MPQSRRPRITQRAIAEMAGVSQAVVSLVVSGGSGTTTRISEETRRRVLDAIKETGYSANPAARMLVGKANDLIGVFTYEAAFPTETSDFYTPLLTGVEAAARTLGQDLLVFTGVHPAEGKRRLLGERNKLRMADGCVLLGREMDNEELIRLIDMEYPFVAVGRRDGDERIPYVGADYRTATAELVDLAVDLGHRRLSYLRLPFTAESTMDRIAGFEGAVARQSLTARMETSMPGQLESIVARIVDSDSTALFVEDPLEAEAVARLAEELGLRIPGDLSIIALGDPARPGLVGRDFTRLVAPRTEIGAHAVRMLYQMTHDEPDEQVETRVLLPCVIERGATLARVSDIH